MLGNISKEQECEGLVTDRNQFPIRLASANPFVVAQEFEFLYKSQQDEMFRHAKQADVTDKFVDDLYKEQKRGLLKRVDRMPQNPKLINNLGTFYLNNGKYDEAISCFKEALKIDDKFMPLLTNMAKAYFLKGKLESALEIYYRIEKMDPKSVGALNNIANILIAQNSFDQAIEYYRRVLKLDQDNYFALNSIATIYLLRNKVDKSISYYRKTIAIKNDLPHINNNLGICYAIKNSYKKAVKCFLVSLHLNYSTGTLLNLARAYQEQKLYEKAIQLLEEFLSKGYDDRRVRASLAYSYARIKDYKNSLKHLKKLLKLYESEGDEKQKVGTLNNIGLIYECMNEYDTAEKYYTLCLINKDLQTPVFVHNAINLYFLRNKTEKAKELTDQGLVLFPDNPLMLESLGRYYFEKGDYEKSQETLKSVVSAKPDMIDPYLLLSVIEMEVNRDTQKALEILMKAVTIDPDNIIVINNLAYNYLLMNDITRAREVLDKVSSQNDKFLYATRGLLLLMEGNLEEGNRLYNLAIKSTFKEGHIKTLIEQKKYLEIGKYYLKRENLKEAQKLLKKVVSIKSKHPYFKDQAEELLQELPI